MNRGKTCQKQILDYTKTTIDALGLTDLDGTYIRKFPWNVGLTGSNCIITPVKETAIAQSTNLAYDVGYGVGVVLYKPTNQDFTSDADALYQWRQDVIAAFADKPVATITPKVYIVKIEPNQVIDLASFRLNFDATSFVLRYFVRHNRP